MKSNGRFVDIYIGDRIALETERLAIFEVYNFLNDNEIQSIIVANSSFTGKQIDLIVATEASVFVIEIKGHTSPLRGGLDGRWKLRTSSGGWKPTGNFYLQTLSAMYELKDSMYAFNKTMISYPTAALVFVFGIHAASEIPSSDEKVQIVDLNYLKTLKSHKDGVYWPLSTWRDFLNDKNLICVESLNHAFDDNLLQSSNRLRDYQNAFKVEYQYSSSDFVSDKFKLNGNLINYEDALHAVSDLDNILIIGPSGCGKTMLSKIVAYNSFQHNRVPILVEAKYFDSQFEALLDDEASLLGIASFKVLAESCANLSKKLMIIVDGFNECPASKSPRLIRYIKDYTEKLDADIVVVTAGSLDGLTSVISNTFEVFEPSLECKIKIAAGATLETIPIQLVELLDSVSTGLEAKIIGSLNNMEQLSHGRFALLIAYVRQVLENGSEGINILSALAEYLSDNLVSSISLLESDRLFSRKGISFEVFDMLFNFSLLKKHGNRISFGHELFLNAFVAESVVRSSGRDSQKITSALNLPRHQDQVQLIVGAIDDWPLTYEVLNQTTNPHIVIACVAGDCGVNPKNWAVARINDLFRKIQDEASLLTFEIDKTAWMNVKPKDKSLFSWDEQDSTFIAAFPEILAKGNFLDEYYKVIPFLETSLKDAFVALVDEAKTQEIYNLRSSLFAVGFLRQFAAVGNISSRLSGFIRLSDRESQALTEWLDLRKNDTSMSDGQLYVILHLARIVHARAMFSKNTINIIRERWRILPYHLKVELLDTVQTLHEIPSHEKEELIEVLNSLKTENIFMSSMILDALKVLDGVDDSGQSQMIQEELREVLRDPENPESWQRAQSIYTSQYDHLFDNLYYEAIQELEDDDKKIILTMAIRFISDFRMFTSLMILDLAQFNDPQSGQYIEPWTEFPVDIGPMPQDTVSVFIVAHVSLGKLAHPIGRKNFNKQEIQGVMAAIGELYYWLARTDCEISVRKANCQPIWLDLAEYPLEKVIHCLYMCSRSLSVNFSRLLGEQAAEDISLWDQFPIEFADVCRRALKDREMLSYHEFIGTRDEILSFAISALGHYGIESDVISLRSLVNDSSIGGAAIRAVKKLQERISK